MASPLSSETRGPVRVWSAEGREVLAEGLCEWEPAMLELPLTAAELDVAHLEVSSVELALSARYTELPAARMVWRSGVWIVPRFVTCEASM